MELLGSQFTLRVEEDMVYKDAQGRGRIFLQVNYEAPCSKSKDLLPWRGRKFYLSDHMLEQEVIFTAFLAFKLAVEHEVMEGFKVDGKVLVNPHVDYNLLLNISEHEVARTPRLVTEV